MSDWDFLHDMHNEGYSAQDISDAAAIGYAPWQTPSFGHTSPKHTSVPQVPQAPSKDQTAQAIQAMEMLRQAGILTRPQFLACKAAILK
jgi:hypothetical protein